MQSNRVGSREFTEEKEVGKNFTVSDILQVLDSERVFINQSKGGVTFSGGEPLLQGEFLLEALMACSENGYHTAVDTSGYSDRNNFAAIMPFTDLFLFDLKHPDDSMHLKYTGVSNRLIMENFRYIASSGKDIFVRIPIIPGINDDMSHLEMLRNFIITAGGNSVKKINLLPYHRIGASKYKRFNLTYRAGDIEPPSKERMTELKSFFSETAIKVKIGG